MHTDEIWCDINIMHNIMHYPGYSNRNVSQAYSTYLI